MSSFISSSDRRSPAKLRSWADFTRTFALVLALCLIGSAALLVVLDPYDTGRLSLVHKRGTGNVGEHLWGASHGRDPAFDSAVIGNSHALLLDPARLSAQTGLHFVSLAMGATGPREQLAVADWFRRHHPDSIGAMVFVLDWFWCEPEVVVVDQHYSFPYWLYADSDLAYVRGLMRFEAMSRDLPQRILLLLGLIKPSAPDGYDPYKRGQVWREADARRFDGFHMPIFAGDKLPAKALLADFLAKLPKGMRLAFLFPPVYEKALPSHKAGIDGLRACKAGYADLAASVGARFIDRLKPDALSSKIENFWDGHHYVDSVARVLEGDIARGVAVEPANAGRPACRRASRRCP